MMHRATRMRDRLVVHVTNFSHFSDQSKCIVFIYIVVRSIELIALSLPIKASLSSSIDKLSKKRV